MVRLIWLRTVNGSLGSICLIQARFFFPLSSLLVGSAFWPRVVSFLLVSLRRNWSCITGWDASSGAPWSSPLLGPGAPPFESSSPAIECPRGDTWSLSSRRWPPPWTSRSDCLDFRHPRMRPRRVHSESPWRLTYVASRLMRKSLSRGSMLLANKPVVTREPGCWHIASAWQQRRERE